MMLRRKNESSVLAMAPLLGTLLLSGYPVLSTDDPLPTTTELIAELREQVSLPQGQSYMRYKPATSIVQGETVFYTVRIHNPTTVAAHDVTTTQKIPINTSYVIGSASGPSTEISFSVDSGHSFLPESQLRVTESNGAQRRPLASEYTHVRWRLRNALAPGATALARFQAVFR
jgi:uncharacterized repeat protein (TIGR01451 family)